MRGEPDWSLVPKEIPPALLVFLRRCLQKDLKLCQGRAHGESVPTIVTRLTATRGSSSRSSWRERRFGCSPNAAWTADGSLWRNGSNNVLTRLSNDDKVSQPFGSEPSDLVPMQALPGDRTALVLRVPLGTVSGPAMLLDLETGSTSTPRGHVRTA